MSMCKGLWNARVDCGSLGGSVIEGPNMHFVNLVNVVHSHSQNGSGGGGPILSKSTRIIAATASAPDASNATRLEAIGSFSACGISGHDQSE